MGTTTIQKFASNWLKIGTYIHRVLIIIDGYFTPEYTVFVVDRQTDRQTDYRTDPTVHMYAAG